jgi:hypothetical protein
VQAQGHTEKLFAVHGCRARVRVASPEFALETALATTALPTRFHQEPYIFSLPDYDIAIGNMLAYNQTAKFSAGSYSFDPHIKNLAMRSGVLLSQPVTFKGKKLSLEYSLIDTRYLSGDRPYSKNSQEIGITVGTNKNAFYETSYIRAGLSFMTAKGSHGFTVNIGYWF